MNPLAKEELATKWMTHFTSECCDFLIENLGSNSHVFVSGDFQTDDGRGCLADIAGRFHPSIEDTEFPGVDFLDLIGLTVTTSHMIGEWDRHRDDECQMEFERELRRIIETWRQARDSDFETTEWWVETTAAIGEDESNWQSPQKELHPSQTHRIHSSRDSLLGGVEHPSVQGWRERETTRMARVKYQANKSTSRKTERKKSTKNPKRKWLEYSDFASLREVISQPPAEPIDSMEANVAQQIAGTNEPVVLRRHDDLNGDCATVESHVQRCRCGDLILESALASKNLQVIVAG